MKKIFLLLASIFSSTANAVSANDILSPENSELLNLDFKIISKIQSLSGQDKIILQNDTKKIFINFDLNKFENSTDAIDLLNMLRSKLGQNTRIHVVRNNEVHLGTQDWDTTK